MIRSVLRDRCETRYRDTGNHLVTATEWNDYLADAEADVFASSPWWPFHENRNTGLVVTSGAAGVALPTDAIRVNSVLNATDRYPLVPLDGRADYRHLYNDPAGQLGNPTHYRLQGLTLEVYPRSQSTLTLEVDYMAAPAVLSSDTAEPVFPETYHRLLVYGALAYAYEDDSLPDMATVHRSRFEQLLERMKDDLLVTRQERYHGITDDFGW